MQDFANQLMAQARGTGAVASSAEDRPVVELPSGPEIRLRVGLWPLLSDTAPEVALGLTVALGGLLEQWQEMLVYRLVAQVDGEPEDGAVWDISHSQFTVDDWQLEHLDENVAVWGTLARTEGGWSLNLKVENDLVEDENIHTLAYDAASLRDLVALLPRAAADIATHLDSEKTRGLATGYEGVTASGLETLLSLAFGWERDLYLWLWGVELDDAHFSGALPAFADQAERAGDFGAWLLALSVGRALRPVTTEIAGSLVPSLADLSQCFKTPAAPVMWGPLLLALDHEREAFDILDASLEADPDQPVVRLALAETHRRAGQLADMLEALQDAIEDGVTSPDLLMMYGNLMVVLRDNNLMPPQFVLLDTNERIPENLAEEAIAAYDAVLDAEPARLDARRRRLTLLIELDDEAVWDGFRKLVEADETGEQVRLVVESFQMIEDLGEGLQILRQAARREADRADLRVNYALALLADEQFDDAAEQLEAAAELTDDPATLRDIERLLLAADDPDFEARIGEITELLDASKPVPLAEIDYLEACVENAPSFTQGYTLLARAYRRAGDDGAALETLLDAQNHLPDDPDIALLLVQVLWDGGERDLAFDYINKSLAVNPDDVPLLALTGRYLFDEDQEEEARHFLTRAESINPQSRMLREVQRYIAGQMGG